MDKKQPTSQEQYEIPEVIDISPVTIVTVKGLTGDDEQTGGDE